MEETKKLTIPESYEFDRVENGEVIWASQAIIIAPGKLKERLEEINRREFRPTIKEENEQ